MSSKIPRTGMTARMRAWMQAQGNLKFTPVQVSSGLDLPLGIERDKLRRIMGDFIRRGEIIQSLDKRKRRQFVYRYNHQWKRKPQGTINKKVYKAMYVSVGSFAVTDIQRLSGEQKRSNIEKIVRMLVLGGYLQKVGRRLCSHGAGAENLYRVTNRDRFRLQVME